MFLGGRLLLLYQQLKSKKHKMCERCGRPYDAGQINCPHCSGLSERELEELMDRTRRSQRAVVGYIVFLFLCLSFLFFVFHLIL
jgi:ribosomal protein L37E